MQKHPQIISIDTEVTAYVIFFPLLKKNFAQQSPVALGKFIQDLADFFSCLFRGKGGEKIDRFVGSVVLFLVLEAVVAGRCPIMLLQNVFTNGVHIRAQAFGMQEFSIAQRRQHSGEGFLAHVVDRLQRTQARAQFDLDQVAEIGDKMVLSTKVARPQAFDVEFVKGMKVQGLVPRPLKWQPV